MKAPGIPNGWDHPKEVPVLHFRCGFCDHKVSSDRGLQTAGSPAAHIRICPGCNRPTLLVPTPQGLFQVPGSIPGTGAKHLPAAVDALYEEVRQSMGVNAYSVAVLGMRKLLMHVAVDCGAPANQTFVMYIDYLADNHYVPPRARQWIDRIRQKGNEATHEIVLIVPADAEELLSFTEMLLKLVYEYPHAAGAPSAP